MRRLILPIAWVLVLALACEPRPEPASTEPIRSEPTPVREPDPVEPEPEPEPSLRAGEVAGVHYVEWISGGARAEDRLPMIIAIHGLGDEPENFSDLLKQLDRPARLIFPRALDAYEGGGWSWFPIRARDQDVDGLAAGIQSAADKLAPAIRELSEQRPTQGKPIVLGFSQGGMLSFVLAVEHPDLFAAAIPLGGWLPPPLWPKRAPPQNLPITALHGDADKAVLIEPTRDCVAQLQKLGYAVELHEYPGVGHMITPEMHDELYDLLRVRIDAVVESNPAESRDLK